MAQNERNLLEVSLTIERNGIMDVSRTWEEIFLGDFPSQKQSGCSLFFFFFLFFLFFFILLFFYGEGEETEC